MLLIFIHQLRAFLSRYLCIASCVSLAMSTVDKYTKMQNNRAISSVNIALLGRRDDLEAACARASSRKGENSTFCASFTVPGHGLTIKRANHLERIRRVPFSRDAHHWHVCNRNTFSPHREQRLISHVWALTARLRSRVWKLISSNSFINNYPRARATSDGNDETIKRAERTVFQSSEFCDICF
jgi:hypothetical protein